MTMTIDWSRPPAGCLIHYTQVDRNKCKSLQWIEAPPEYSISRSAIELFWLQRSFHFFNLSCSVNSCNPAALKRSPNPAGQEARKLQFHCLPIRSRVYNRANGAGSGVCYLVQKSLPRAQVLCNGELYKSLVHSYSPPKLSRGNNKSYWTING